VHHVLREVSRHELPRLEDGQRGRPTARLGCGTRTRAAARRLERCRRVHHTHGCVHVRLALRTKQLVQSRRAGLPSRTLPQLLYRRALELGRRPEEPVRRPGAGALVLAVVAVPPAQQRPRSFDLAISP